MEGAKGQPKGKSGSGAKKGGKGGPNNNARAAALPNGNSGRVERKGTAEPSAVTVGDTTSAPPPQISDLSDSSSEDSSSEGSSSSGSSSSETSDSSSSSESDSQSSSIDTELVNPAGSAAAGGNNMSNQKSSARTRLEGQGQAWDVRVEEATVGLEGVTVSGGATRTPPRATAAGAPAAGSGAKKGQGDRAGNQASSQQASLPNAKPSTADAEQPQGENTLEGSSNSESSSDSSSSSSSEVSSSEEDDEQMSWISWFVSLKGNEFFCEVDDEYIRDDFNLTGLSSLVPYYDYALDMILDVEESIESLTEQQQEVVESAAEMLYGLIHARFILTARGMQAMREKFLHSHFGRCPRVYCQMQAVLPIGLSDNPRVSTVNVYCPKCQDIFVPRSLRHASLDGAYFGSTFAHYFLLTSPELCQPKPDETYTPRIYGFKINKESSYYKAAHEPEAVARRAGRGSSGNLKGKAVGERRLSK